MSEQETGDLVAFLGSLTGDLPADFAQAPILPPAGFAPTSKPPGTPATKEPPKRDMTRK